MMTYHVSNLDSVLASVAGVPMTLESGISFDSDLTAMLMSCAPFFIKPYYDGFKLVASNGSLLFFIDHVCEAKTYENGYTFFRDCEGKYNFTPYFDTRKKTKTATTSTFPLSYPVKKTPNFVSSFEEISSEEKSFARKYWEDYAEEYGDVKKYFVNRHNQREQDKVEAAYKYDVRDYEQELSVWKTLGFCKVSCVQKVDKKAYCDTKVTKAFTFSRAITKEEFLSYLGLIKATVREAKDWYDSYSIIEGDGDRWSYTWVTPSTH